jgi:antitoxin component YwqK of YwqJK toxin-antitoxin module
MYEGEWKDGVADGFGTFYYKNNGKYEGEWKNDVQHGFGK